MRPPTSARHKNFGFYWQHQLSGPREDHMINPLAFIIEDDENLAKIFTYALQNAGFETETIQYGNVALARLAAVVPAVVVLDLHLPYILGGEILDQIRADERLIETQVILTTGDALMAEKYRNDADLVLLKPISVNQLTQLASRLYPPI